LILTGLAKKLAKEWTGKVFEAKDEAEANSRGVDIVSDASGWCLFELNYKKEAL
jgi:hypothetical protein